MNVEDRKDILTQLPGVDAKSNDTKPAKADDDTPRTDEDYHNAAALAHRPAAH